MGQTVERAADFFRGEELSFFYDAHLAHHPSTDRRKFAAEESQRNLSATDSSPELVARECSKPWSPGAKARAGQAVIFGAPTH
jgi:hypothetical protein